MKRRTLLFLLVCLPLTSWSAEVTSPRAAVFQYSLPVTTTKMQPSAAFLWLPSQVVRIRGVLLLGTTLMEADIARDPLIRQTCADEHLAIVMLKCGLGAIDIKKLLHDFADVSGYQELPSAPLLFIGHSAGGPQAKALGIELADRCFGIVQIRGGVPSANDKGEADVPVGVPSLMMVGQFDEFGGTMRDENGRETWQGGRDALRAFRKEDERRLASIVVEPGAGHFAWSERNAKYLSLWIKKAAQARIPAAETDDKTPVTCRKIDYQSGWLSDISWEQTEWTPAAPYGEYRGDKRQANWLFDQELTQATEAYHRPQAGGFKKRDQFIAWNDATFIDAGVRHFFNKIDWCDDGQTFEVHPVFAEKYPATKAGSGGPRWATAGQPAGHTNGPIRARPVGGPIVAVGENRLRIQFDALSPAGEGGRVTFLAYHPGDAEYRHTEHVGMLPRGFKGFTEGQTQTITFPTIGGLQTDSPPVPLNATSDAQLPVEYYIAAGPAVIEAGKLKLTEIPRRATFPLTVKVVAYQFGRGLGPKVKSASPIEQTIQIQAKSR